MENIKISDRVLYDDEGRSEWILFQLYILRMVFSGLELLDH